MKWNTIHIYAIHSLATQEMAGRPKGDIIHLPSRAKIMPFKDITQREKYGIAELLLEKLYMCSNKKAPI
jgi:hypothetical protein